MKARAEEYQVSDEVRGDAMLGLRFAIARTWRAGGFPIVALLILGAAAHAQTVRYISVIGNDAAACSFAAPCRTLVHAIAVAPTNGEVRLANSGDFGSAVTIAKSLTISGAGNTLELSGPITVDDAAAKVALRDLVLDGSGVRTIGIVVSAAASVHIVRTTVQHFTSDGVSVTASPSEVFVTDSIFRDNGDNGLTMRGSGVAMLTVDTSRFENNAGKGLDAGNAHASATRSTFSGNGNDGVSVDTSGTLSVAWSTASNNTQSGFVCSGSMQLESSVASGNGSFGIVDFAGTLVISNDTSINNDTGVEHVATRQNNRVTGNTTNVILLLPPVPGT